MAVYYEWDIETYDLSNPEEPEVYDHDFRDKLSELLYRIVEPFLSAMLEGTGKYRLVLVRDDDEGNRSWAYVEAGNLPEWFKDAYDNETTKVPVRYRKEFDSVIRRISDGS